MAKFDIDRVKVQISLSVDLCARVDAIAKEIGMDRSQLCCYFIGKQVKQEEAQAAALASMVNGLPPAVASALKGMLPEGKAVEEEAGASE